ncbi:SDR family NAD(P)-dependent oxidoreductase [Streptomyces olivaceus]|uniref:SDR family NAD(P)-dependent oxidoreductase n=1 Tax=Streptomyces olivaceus TaxID=47716 RepID=UPI001CCEAA1C|nr:SDR family NAD(P)-dependent oxidoreductase [Streptomyces olivaceus]MBZ6084289.1 SDR family NAD(P)-dependent oxidoreductase [Streptomyces olivaceus]
MDLQLEDRHALVTGASKGIGLAIVRVLVNEGVKVTATARRLSSELRDTGATFVAADLSIPKGPCRMVESALAEMPQLDILVNNAGGGILPDETTGDPFDVTENIWASTLALNFSAAVETTRAALPALVKTKGAVINISSDSARRPGGDPLAYSSAKAALNAFTRGLAERVAALGVRVNAVSPSLTRTNLTTGKDGYMAGVAAGLGMEHEALLRAMPKQNGMLTDSMIDPMEIARVVALLASPTMPSAIGGNWTIDAGATKFV